MLLRAALIAFTLAAGAAGALAREPASALEGSIHRFGPDARQLRFEGEASARTWSIYVTMAQAQTRARVRLTYSNAISVMPETSRLTIFVNDVQVAQAPIAAASDPGGVDVELPRGLLTAGYNRVRIAVSQRHRVDCSLEATYELWTQLDPAASGLTFPELADPGINTLDDLAAISPDPSGAVAIRAVLPQGAAPSAIDRVLRAVEAVTIRAGIVRPNVEIVDAIDNRPGLWVIAGLRADLDAQGLHRFAGDAKEPALAGRDVPGRLIVVAAGDDPDETQATIGKILPSRPLEPASVRPGSDPLAPTADPVVNVSGFPVVGRQKVSFSELGLQTEEFNGRLYRAGFDLLMPPDFYPADYDKLTLSISAGYAKGLSPGAQILVRVNDKEAGSMPMRNPRGDLFEDRPIAVSLSALRPGVNRIVVEAQTPAPEDAACEVRALMDPEKRFVLFDRSELIVPDLARIARMPNLAASLSSGFPYSDANPGRLFFARRDPATIAAAATFLARTAFVAQHPIGAHVTFDNTDLRTSSGFIFGALADFDPKLFGLFGVDYAGLRNAWTTPGAIEAANADGLVATPRAAPAATPEIYDQWAQGIKVAPADFGARNSPRAIYDRYINVHRRDFAWLRDPPSLIEAPERSTLLIAQMRGPGAGANTWTLVVAANGAELTKDMRGLVAPANWNAVEGRAAAFKPRGGVVNLTGAPDSYFIVTQPLTPGNLRLVAAGWFSSNIDYFALAFALGAIVLGALTTWTVRVHGARH